MPFRGFAGNCHGSGAMIDGAGGRLGRGLGVRGYVHSYSVLPLLLTQIIHHTLRPTSTVLLGLFVVVVSAV